jgi:putative oxidoreductase
MGLSSLGNYKNFALLFLRVGLGIMFILHGYPKIMGGPEKWEAIGGAVSSMGITFYPVFWGFMAAVSEFVGGILLILGLGMRIASFFIFITMVVASVSDLKSGESILGASHTIELAIVFFGLIFLGPGKYSIDKK